MLLESSSLNRIVSTSIYCHVLTDNPRSGIVSHHFSATEKRTLSNPSEHRCAYFSVILMPRYFVLSLGRVGEKTDSPTCRKIGTTNCYFHFFGLRLIHGAKVITSNIRHFSRGELRGFKFKVLTPKDFYKIWRSEYE